MSRHNENSEELVLQLGRFTIKPFSETSVWISSEGGEGGEFSASLLEAALVSAIEQFYQEHF